MRLVRLMRDEDIPALSEIMRHKSEQLGVDFWLPPLHNCRVVFVIEEDGKPMGALVFKDVTEMIMVGDVPAVVSGLMKEERKIRAVLNREGVDNMVSFVPLQLITVHRKSGMQRILERLKFRRIDTKFAAFEGEVYHGTR